MQVIGGLQKFKASYLKALAHPVRIRVLEVLRQGELSVAELQSEAGADVANISQHLAVLRSGGVVVARKTGMNVLYRVRDGEVFVILDALRQIFSNRLDSMQTMLDEDNASLDADPAPDCQA